MAKWRLFGIGGHFYGEYFYSDAKASYFVFPVVGCIYTVIRGVEVCTEQCIKLYRIVEFVGRWSMIDVFVVALLTALIQIQSLATILAGPGSIAFGAVVVLTMFASLSFDPRIIWDNFMHLKIQINLTVFLRKKHNYSGRTFAFE